MTIIYGHIRLNMRTGCFVMEHRAGTGKLQHNTNIVIIIESYVALRLL